MAPFYTPRLILKVLFTRFIVTNLRRIMMALFFGLKWLAIIFCFILFVLLMLDSYKKFTNKLTNVGVRTEPMDKSKKIPPCITVCAFEAFRTTGFFYREADFIRETFKKEDIILDGNKYDFVGVSIFNDSIFSIKEIRSLFLGRCYTICQKVTLKENPLMYVIVFNKTKDLKG